jgi:NAD(P)-dependent dehydrogenase (short-subunit alcohol dehydrogenase family)
MKLAVPGDLRANLTGHCALVTGASGTFGAHFARVLAASGARVVLAARRTELLAALAMELSAGGAAVATVPLDVTSAESVAAAFLAVPTEFGVPDIVINNAGASHAALALDQSEEDWDRVVDTNLKGAFLVAQEAARRLIAAGRGGSIINIASVLGLRQAATVAPYAASKAGLIQLTRELALEWARHDIRVNAIAPGYFLSDLNREFFATQAGEALVKRVPQRRLGEPADLDGALLLLASDASRFMTGAVLSVDGGHSVSTL